jgi:hypothetical protein
MILMNIGIASRPSYGNVLTVLQRIDYRGTNLLISALEHFDPLPTFGQVLVGAALSMRDLRGGYRAAVVRTGYTSRL